MTLRPCSSCRRHVREEQCPFCGAIVPASARLPAVAGRLSRAAVFAGATLAGCTSTPAPQYASPPPPPDEQHAVIGDAAPPADAGERTFATPPPDAAAPAPGNAIIRGTAKYSNGGLYAERPILLYGGGMQRHVLTDAKGRYEFTGLPSGEYTVTVEEQASNNPRHSPPPAPMYGVSLANGKVEVVDVSVAVYVEPVDRGPCCKPYGAPPARRRVV